MAGGRTPVPWPARQSFPPAGQPRGISLQRTPFLRRCRFLRRASSRKDQGAGSEKRIATRISHFREIAIPESEGRRNHLAPRMRSRVPTDSLTTRYLRRPIAARVLLITTCPYRSDRPGAANNNLSLSFRPSSLCCHDKPPPLRPLSCCAHFRFGPTRKTPVQHFPPHRHCRGKASPGHRLERRSHFREDRCRRRSARPAEACRATRLQPAAVSRPLPLHVIFLRRYARS